MRTIIAGLTVTAAGLALFAALDSAGAESKSAFNMEQCMANVQARGLTAQRAAHVCQRNSRGKMYRSVPGTTTPKDWGR